MCQCLKNRCNFASFSKVVQNLDQNILDLLVNWRDQNIQFLFCFCFSCEICYAFHSQTNQPALMIIHFFKVFKSVLNFTKFDKFHCKHISKHTFQLWFADGVYSLFSICFRSIWIDSNFYDFSKSHLDFAVKCNIKHWWESPK